MKHKFISVPSVLAGALLLAFTATAQTVIPASNADIPITSGGSTDARNVNCDMILHAAGGGQLRAIAYDDYATTQSYVYLEDYAAGTVTIAIPGATDIDVVLGDDMNNPGNDYVVAVVYNMSGAPYIETYTISGVGGGSLSATLANSAMLPLVTGGASYMPPHIDLYPDMNTYINGIPALYQYAVTWTEYQGPGTDIYATHGDITNPGSFGNVYTVATFNGVWPDIACLVDLPTGDVYAYVPYINWPNIDLWEVNLTTTGTSTTAGINATGVEKSVRIEAMNQYDPGAGLQKYEIAYAGFTGTILDMFSYNDLTGNTNLSAALPGNNNIHPAVSAGPGILFNGGYGNENHSVCWYNDGTPYYYSQAIETTTGAVSGGYPDYYEVNQTPTPFIVLDAYYAPIAVSTSSNWGDELLTAWNNNNDIYYKYQPDIGQYKITNVNEVKPATFKLFPNPAGNIVYIAGATNAAYVITDVSGRAVASGSITNSNNSINVSLLKGGLYIISITENGHTATRKFLKQ